MVNQRALARIKELEIEYEKTWGQKVNYSIMPRGISQEKLVKVLEIMIETGDSILVAYEKYKRMMDTHKKP